MNVRETTIPKSTFNTLFVQYNDLNAYSFEEWVFYPGMLFQDLHTWWSNGDVRPTPHEGIDICFFRDKNGQVRRLGKDTNIPVMYDGEIIHIHDDFLGKSIYVKHNSSDKNGKALYTIYGHTIPENHYGVGKIVCEGDIIATIAADATKGRRIPPHLHITTAWLPESLSRKELNWQIISDPQLVALCNPLDLIDCRYHIDNDQESPNLGLT